MRNTSTADRPPVQTGGGRLAAAVDAFLAPRGWQVMVSPIRRFGTIDRVTRLLAGLSDVSGLRIRHLDRGVATFDLVYRGQFAIDTLLANALAPLGATVVIGRSGCVDVDLDADEPATTDHYGFGRRPAV